MVHPGGNLPLNSPSDPGGTRKKPANERSSALVLCHSGYKYAQEPRSIIWGGEQLQVEQIQSSWQSPKGPAFLAKVKDGRLFEISYDEQLDEWDVRLV
jgi:hypothetical protein